MLFDLHTHKTYFPGIINMFLSKDCRNEIKNSFFYSIGVHPYHAENVQDDWEMLLYNLASYNNVIAIGETGLDARYPNLNKQEEIFRYHAKVAEEFSLPIIIHCVKCYHLLLKIKKDFKSSTWIVHGYCKNLFLAESLIDKNCLLSFGSKILNNTKLLSIIPKIGLSNIFLETDNSVVSIGELYESLSNYMKIPISELDREMKLNVLRVFGEKLAI